MNYKLQGIRIKIKNPKPYRPSFLTELLGNSIKIRKNSIVCDVGCGCGILAVLASKLGAKKAYAIDIDINCRDSIEINSKANNAKNIVFLQGSMLNPLKEKVDIIIASLPQMPSNKKIDIHRYGSVDGAKFNVQLIKNAPKYLKKNGAIFFSLMSISNPIKIFNLLKNQYYISVIAAKERKFEEKRFEELSKGLCRYILELNKKNKAILYFRNGNCYFINYIIKAELR